jgi:hypothetical protein
MLQCKRRTQPTNTASHYGYSRDFHRTRLQCTRLKRRLKDAVQRSWLRQSSALQFRIIVVSTDFCRCRDRLRQPCFVPPHSRSTIQTLEDDVCHRKIA